MADSKTVSVSWGKPKISIRKIADGEEWKVFATPVEDSTQLNPTKGDKLEAPIEGGGNEAVKYKKNTNELVFDVRQVPERNDPITEVDGVVDGEYEIKIEPENTAALAAHIKRSACSVETKYTAADGIVKTYTFDVLQPEEGAQIDYGVASELFKDEE
jgi:hypothetical protein